MKSKTRTKALSWLLLAAMLLGLIPTITMPVIAEELYIIKINGVQWGDAVALPIGSTVDDSTIGIDILSPHTNNGIYYYSGSATSSSNPAVVEMGTGDWAHHMCIKGAGTTTISYTGAPPFTNDTGNYSFTITVVSASKSISDCTFDVSDVTYDGNPHQQSFTITDGSKTLVQNTDYTITYPSDCTNAGEKTVTITGIGGYTGTVTKTYTINKAAGAISYSTNNLKKHLTDAAFINTLTKTGNGNVTYGSSKPSVATVASDGKVTIVSAGSTTITATVEDSANYTYNTKTASYTLNVWEPKLISVDTHITEESVPSGTIIDTSAWTVTAYYAAKDTSIPADNNSDEDYNFASDPNWDVVSGVTSYKVNGSAPKNETISKNNRSFIVTYSTAPATTVDIPLSPFELTAESPNGEVIFTVEDMETTGAYEGQTPITVEVIPDEGYSVSNITAKMGNDTITLEGTGNTRTFTMPNGNVKVTVTYSEDKYAITASSAENGTYTATVNTVTATEAVPGSVVMIESTPSEGYAFKSLTVTKTGSDPVEYVDNFGTGFIMPDYPVTISVEFELLPTDTATAWRLLNTTNYPVGSTLYTGRYYLTEDVTFDGSSIGNGLKIANGATVYIYLNDHTLGAIGKAAKGMTGGFAGIYLPNGATLYFVGDGSVNAVGGNAADGSNGTNGAAGYAYASCSSGLAGYLGGTSKSARGGKGGSGGNGGGGAGAGIGTNGTSGVTASTTYSVKTNTNKPASAGTVNLLGNVSFAGSKGGDKGANGNKGANGADRYKQDSFKRWPFKTKKCSAFGGGGAGGSGGQGGNGGAIVGPGGQGGNGGAKGGNGNSKTQNSYGASATAATAAGTNSASSSSKENSAVQYYLRGINADTKIPNNLFAVDTTISGNEDDVLDTLTLKAYYTKTSSDKMTNYGGNTDTDWAVIDIPQDKISTVSLTNQTNTSGTIVAGGNNILVSYDPGTVSSPITVEMNITGEQTNTQFRGAAGDYKDVKSVKYITYDNSLHNLTKLFDFSDSWNATYAVLYTPYNKFKDNKVTNKDSSASPATFEQKTPYSNANNWMLGGADSTDAETYFKTADKYFNGTAYTKATDYSAWLGNYVDFGKVQVKNAGLYTVYERNLDWKYNANGTYTPTYRYNTYYILIEQADLAIDQATDAVYEPTKVQDHRFTRFVEGQSGEQVYGTFSFDASYGEAWGNDEHLMINAATPLQRDLQWEYNLFGDLTGVKDQYTDSDRVTIAYGSKNMNNYLCQNDGQSAEDQKTADGDIQNTYYKGTNGAISYRNQTVDPDPAPSGINIIPGAMELTVKYVGTQAKVNTNPGKSTKFTTAPVFKSEPVITGYPGPNYAEKSDDNTISSVYAEDIKISGKLTRNDLGWRVVAGDKITGDTSYGNKVTDVPNPAYTSDLISGDAYNGDLYVITVMAGDTAVATVKYTDTSAVNSVNNVVSALAEQLSDKLPACEYYGVDYYTVTVDYYGLYYTTETSTSGRAPAWSGEEEFQWVVTGVRFYLDVAQREVTLRDTKDFDKIYDGSAALVHQTTTDGDVTAAKKYVTELTTVAPATPGQFAKKADTALYNYLDPTGNNTMYIELAGDYSDKNKGVDKNIAVMAARFLKTVDTVPAAGDKVAALNYIIVDGNGTATPETKATLGIASVTGDIDVAQMHFTHNPYGALTVYDLTSMHEAFGLHAKAYLLTATAENGFYKALDMALTELVEADDAGTDSYGQSLTEYDYAITYSINDTVKYDQYMTDKTLSIDASTGAVTHAAQRSIGSTNPANFPAMNITIGNFPNFKLVSNDTADINLNTCTLTAAQNTKTTDTESWQHIMRFRVKGNANNYDLILPVDQLNARPVPSAFINRSGGVLTTKDSAEKYQYITVYPNGDAAQFDFTIPQDSYLEDVKIVAVKVGEQSSDYKTIDNATSPIPNFAALLADTANEIGTFNTQSTVGTGMNHIANPLWLSLVKVNGNDVSTLTNYTETKLADANSQSGGGTFRFELRTGACELGENYAIAVVPLIKSYNGKLLGDHEDVVEPATAYTSNLSVEKTITSATDSTLIDGKNDNVYINYKTLFDTTAYGKDNAAADGYVTLEYKAPDTLGAINNGAAMNKQVSLDANKMAQFNSLAIDTEKDTNFFDPTKLLPGTIVTVKLYVWRDGVSSGVQAATADDSDAYDTVSFTWKVSESDYYSLFTDDAVVIRSNDATTDYSNILGYAISTSPATMDFTNATFCTNHSTDMAVKDTEWTVKTGFNILESYADTWYKTGANRMVIDSTAKTMAGLANGDNLYPTYEYAKLQRVTTTNGAASLTDELGYARMIFGKIDPANAFVYPTEAEAQIIAPYGDTYTGATKTTYTDTDDLYLFDGWFNATDTVVAANVADAITGTSQSTDVYTMKEHVNFVTFMDGTATVGYGILDTSATTVASTLDFAAVPFTSARPTFGKANETANKNMTFSGTDAYKKSGYTLNGWYLNNSTSAVDTKAAVTASANDTFYLKSSRSGSGGGGGGGGSSNIAVAKKYSVNTADSIEHGSVKIINNTAESGASVTFTVTPDKGYKVDNVVVTDENGNNLDVIMNNDGTYSLAMPATAITVNATFVEDPSETSVNTGVEDWLICDAHDAYISGYADGTVKPQGNITRAEVAMIFYRLLKNKNVTITAMFSDVPQDSWYAEAVNTLASVGVIKGVSDGTYEPMRSITRAEFATIATRFANANDGIATFSDVPENHWAYGNIASAAAYGWIKGYTDGTFAPQGKITRAEVAAIVNRMTGRSADEAYINANPNQIKQFTDLQDVSKWYYLDMIEASNAHDFTKENSGEMWN